MMDESVPKLHRSRSWFFASLALVFLRALPNMRFPLERDSATYCLVAEWMLHGLRLYRDLLDNKPPGIFYLYVPIVKLFGPVMWCVGVMDIVWLLLISYCIFRIVQRYLGAAAAALAVLINAGWHSTQGYVHAGQPETYLMLCIFIAYLLMLPRGYWPPVRWFCAAFTRTQDGAIPSSRSMPRRMSFTTRSVASRMSIQMITTLLPSDSNTRTLANKGS